MDFDYSCFISYRHGQREIVQGFVDQFEEALSAELEPSSPLNVFIDKTRFSAGTKLNASIGDALCKSACMIVIYTPRYFDRESTYCTREFMAMQQIEKFRNQLVPSRTKSMIVPVVFRGKEDFPYDIFDSQENVVYADFEKFALGERRILKHPKHFSKIKSIAEHIKSITEMFRQVDVCKHCSQFQFPGDDEARVWLDKNIDNEDRKFPLTE